MFTTGWLCLVSLFSFYCFNYGKLPIILLSKSPIIISEWNGGKRCRRKYRWILALVFLLTFGALFLLRSYWQPWFLGLILPRRQKLESIKLVLDLLNGLAALLPAIVGLVIWLLRRDPEKRLLILKVFYE